MALKLIQQWNIVIYDNQPNIENKMKKDDQVEKLWHLKYLYMVISKGGGGAGVGGGGG